MRPENAQQETFHLLFGPVQLPSRRVEPIPVVCNAGVNLACLARSNPVLRSAYSFSVSA